MSETTPSRSSAFSPRPKLRASCDGCYLTKIRCDKARPMCSRCLTYGIDCVYSPSSRSGRAKKDPVIERSRAGSESLTHTDIYSEARQIPGTASLSLPSASFSDAQFSWCDARTMLTPDAEQPFRQYFMGDIHSAGQEGEIILGGNRAEIFDSFSFLNVEVPFTRAACTFPDHHLLPLTSHLLSSSTDLAWYQFSDSQLDFTTDNSHPLHATTYSTPKTNLNAIIPEHLNYSPTYYQDLGAAHHKFSTGFGPSL